MATADKTKIWIKERHANIKLIILIKAGRHDKKKYHGDDKKMLGVS